MVTDIPSLIALWPGPSVLARDVGVTNGAVNQWRIRKSIPSKYHIRVIRAAERRGLGIDAYKLAELHAIAEDAKEAGDAA